MSAEDLIAHVREESRALARAASRRRLGPIIDTDLTIQQLKIVLLVASGEAMTGSALAEALGVTAPTVSNVVDKLVESGYLVRTDGDGDRRVKLLRPTTAGTGLREAVLDQRGASEEVLAELDPADLQALLRGLTAWRRAAESLAARESHRGRGIVTP